MSVQTDTYACSPELLVCYRESENRLDAIYGSLFGGAVGDALGYPVEFLSLSEIRRRFGAAGITSYVLDPKTGKALVSDDTQMTLFTAVGVLYAITRGRLRGIAGPIESYVERAYREWLTTQYASFETRPLGKESFRMTWLLDVPALYAARAPGNTCLSALRAPEHTEDVFQTPRNNSKGCGGIMRVAPVGMCNASMSPQVVAESAARIAAVTHGHSLGYMPAAVVAHLVHTLIYREQPLRLLEAIDEAKSVVCELFAGDSHLEELCHAMDTAVALAENGESDDCNIEKLGEGWVAEETLAIALYCALRYENDFSAGVMAAVNHSGDSDSTGAVVGNILGAIHGYAAIEQKWKTDLEMATILREVALDLCHGCQMSEYGQERDELWLEKYVYGRHPHIEELLSRPSCAPTKAEDDGKPHIRYTPMTKKAMRLCFDLHKNQTDKSGLPYVFHPFHLAEQMTDEDTATVALLHDTVEDCGITLQDLLAMGFPARVVEAIGCMTHQEGVPYLEYVREIAKNPLAAQVKLADLKHNSDLTRLDTVTEKDLARVEKYKKAIAILEKAETEEPTIR